MAETRFTGPVQSDNGFTSGADRTPVQGVTPQANPGAAPVSYDETYLQSLVDALVAAGVLEPAA